MKNSKKSDTTEQAAQDPNNPKPTLKGKLMEVLAFYPAMDADERGYAYGFGLVAESTVVSKYVATVQKVGGKQLLANPDKMAAPEKHHRFVCRTCSKHVKVAELATTVQKREEKLKADPTARVKSFRQCPPCEADERKRGDANREQF